MNSMRSSRMNTLGSNFWGSLTNSEREVMASVSMQIRVGCSYRLDEEASFCPEFCLIAGGKIPYESYVYPKKPAYDQRKCSLVDKSV
jgi:hypothetical protein